MSKNFTVSGRRSRAQRLTPAGWFLLIFALVMGLLLLFGVGRWVIGQWPVWFPPEVVATATTIPTPTQESTPEATPTAVAEVAFPAWWAEGMTQDAAGNWWPAEDAREQVQKMVIDHYVEGAAVLADRPEDEILRTVTDEEAQRYQAGKTLENWFWYKQRWLDTGRFNERTQIVTEQTFMVQAFSPDGLTCQIGRTLQQAHLLQYNSQTDTWDRIEIPENGLLDGTQYYGVAITEMQYDQEDGRWKMARFVQWIPRP